MVVSMSCTVQGRRLSFSIFYWRVKNSPFEFKFGGTKLRADQPSPAGRPIKELVEGANKKLVEWAQQNSTHIVFLLLEEGDDGVGQEVYFLLVVLVDD